MYCLNNTRLKYQIEENFITDVTFSLLIRYIMKQRIIMRRLSSLLVAMLLLGIGSTMAQRYNISGRVVDANNAPIAYATVILTQDDQSKQITGGTTNNEGDFSITANSGKYELNITFIGYNLY